jgi:hypothetical protein
VWLVTGPNANGRLDKTPVGANGYTAEPATAGHALAVEHLAAVRATGTRATAGVYLPAASPYALVDIDGGCDYTTGAISPAAAAWLAANPTAWREWSVSGTGVHIIARVPAGWDYGHTTKIPGGDLYSQLRGVAFGWGGGGDVNAVLCVPPGVSLERSAGHDWDDAATAGVMPNWDGITDNDELIERFTASRGSAVARFSGALSNDELWRGAVPEGADRSQIDAQLAERLSWWTGADAQRVHRLMLQSELARDKWDSRPEYLQRTVAHACAQVRRGGKCYTRPAPPPALPPIVALDTPPIATPALPTEHQGMPAARAIIASASTLQELETACARVVGMSLDVTRYEWKDLQQRVKQHATTALNASGFTIQDARQMLPAATGGAAIASTAASPDWVQDWCYLASTNTFFYRAFPEPMSKEAAERMMLRLYRDTLPVTANGKHQSPSELFFATWDGNTAWTHAYFPGRGPMVDIQGVPYCNTYNAETIPDTPDAVSPGAAAAIQRIHAHIELMCDRRPDVTAHLLQWLANAVLRPGAKTLWAPLIQGAQGSGKSFLGYMLRKALGDNLYFKNGALAADPAGHVRVVGPNDLTNSGGFTDWAVGRAVTVLEEIYVSGGRKWDVDNAMKTFLTEPLVSINRKGAGMLNNFPNVCNYIAFTNHRDAVPMGEGSRRWFVLFTTVLDAMLFESKRYMETDYFPGLWQALVTGVSAGDLRAWLNQYLTPTMPQRAPATRERSVMAEESDSDVTAAAREYANGAAVVALERLSAHLLTRGHRSVSKKELRRALNDCGYQRWQGGDAGRATHAGVKLTLFTQPHLNNEQSGAALTAYML